MEFSISCQLPLAASDMWRIRASAGFRRHVVEDGLLKKLDCVSSSKGPDQDGYHTRTQRYVPTKVDCPDFLRRVIGDALFDVTDEQKWCEHTGPDPSPPGEYRQHFSIRPTHLAHFCVTNGVLKLAPVDRAANNSPDVMDNSGDEDLDDVTDDECEDERGCESDGGRASIASDDSNVSIDNGAPLSSLSYLPAHERCTHVVEGTTKVNLPGAGWAVERAIIHNLRVFYEMYPATVANFRKKLYEKFANGDKTLPISQVIDRFLKHEEDTESVSDETSSSGGSGSEPDEDVVADLGSSNTRRPAFEQRTGSKSLEEQLEQMFV